MAAPADSAPSALTLLGGSRYFQPLPAELLATLAAGTQLRHVEREVALFSEDEPCAGLFLVKSGELKVSKLGPDGREQILYLARDGRVIAEGVRFEPGPYPAAAIALRPSDCYLLPNRHLERLIPAWPALSLALVNLLAGRITRLIGLAEALSLRPVSSRLAAFLYTQAIAQGARPGRPFTLVRDMTVETVGARLGTVREEISRGLGQLEAAGLLRVGRKGFEILDLERLGQAADEPIGRM